MVSIFSNIGLKLKRYLPYLVLTFFSLSPTCRDPEIGLLQNLKDLLEIDFPSRAVIEKSVSCFLLMISCYFSISKI